ncbi:hypothetical protein APHAL10511_002796 [Amanita phalloides]|nr:hypothetical protein APHAL10511_002796 [Amanita phalloides]
MSTYSIGSPSLVTASHTPNPYHHTRTLGSPGANPMPEAEVIPIRFIVVHKECCPHRQIWCSSHICTNPLLITDWIPHQFGVPPPQDCTCKPDTWTFTPPTCFKNVGKTAAIQEALFKRWIHRQPHELDQKGMHWIEAEALLFPTANPAITPPAEWRIEFQFLNDELYNTATNTRDANWFKCNGNFDPPFTEKCTECNLQNAFFGLTM